MSNHNSLLDAIMAAQHRDGYLSEEAMVSIGQVFNLLPSMVYETASFYSMVRFEPPKKIDIKICKSAPCHVAGASDLIKSIENLLEIKLDQTCGDQVHAFGTVECLGQCGQGPALLINDDLYTGVTEEDLIKILKEKGVTL
jgi:NADH:ubiquinone oxidoreductase subunit E